MGLFSKDKDIPVDFRIFTLADIVQMLEDERFFERDPPFYVLEKMSDNQVIFETPATKLTPKQRHTVEYISQQKVLKLSGRYKHLFFPSYVIYLLPLMTVYGADWEDLQTKWPLVLFAFAIPTFLILFGGYTGVRSDVSLMERELILRLNVLLRKKGLPAGL
ncbi:MAG: hypothetical protein AAFV25_13905 [Bacteroidota bacterium]